MFTAQEIRCYYYCSFKSAAPGQTKHILNKVPQSLELLLCASGNMVSLVLFSSRQASSGTGAGFLWKQDFCNQAACVHAPTLQPPLLNANQLFNLVADFDQTWQRGGFSKMLPSYIFNEYNWPGNGKKLHANPMPARRCSVQRSLTAHWKCTREKPTKCHNWTKSVRLSSDHLKAPKREKNPET